MSAFIMADVVKCTGCCVCEIVCVVTHQQNQDYVLASPLASISRIRVIKDDTFTTAAACHQCEDASYANVCPTHAIRHKHGRIFVEQARYIDCKNCMLACPFGAINVVTRSPRVRAIKCDLCQHREVGPACAEVCPTSTLQRVDAVSTQRQRLRPQPL